MYTLSLPLPWCGWTETSLKVSFLGKAPVVCPEGFPYHHAESRARLNQSFWKTLCLVTCGFPHIILQRLVHNLEGGLDRWTCCKYCQGRPRLAGFISALSWVFFFFIIFSQVEKTCGIHFSCLVVFLTTNITTVVKHWKCCICSESRHRSHSTSG